MQKDDKSKQDVMTNSPAEETFTTFTDEVTFTHKELMNTEFRTPDWTVQGLIPEGLTLIVGKTKIGKSLLVLGLASRVAEGGKAFDKIDVEPRDVLYFALEDTPQRLQQSLRAMNGETEGTDRLHFATSGPMKGETATSFLERHIKHHPAVKLIIIDTLGLFCGRGISSYKASYDQMAEIKAVADKHALAIIVVHHARKVKAEDPFDCILGSTGFSAAPDTLVVLTRDRGQNDASLTICGREVKDNVLALQFQPRNLSWRLLGPANEVRMSHERQEVLDLLRKENRDVKLKEISEVLGKKRPVLSKLLNGLIEDGLVEQPKYGSYRAVPTSNGETSSSGECGESLPGGETSLEGETSLKGEIEGIGETVIIEKSVEKTTDLRDIFASELEDQNPEEKFEDSNDSFNEDHLYWDLEHLVTFDAAENF
jgi:DNA-binding transcriptional ArsR family regulator